MKKKMILIGAAVLVLAVLAAVLLVFARPEEPEQTTAATTEGPVWQEEYDLGVRYLNEGNYQEAVLAFNAAIEIDPRQADSYLMLAEAYIAQNDFETALKVLEDASRLLEDERITRKIEEIKSGNIRDYWGNIRKRSHYDAAGNLVWYHEIFYAGRQEIGITSYDGAGNETSRVDYVRDEDGKYEVGSGYSGDSGVLFRIENEYDTEGKLIKQTGYWADTGAFLNSFRYTYNEYGLLFREEFYDVDENLFMYYDRYYDEQNLLIRMECYYVDNEAANVIYGGYSLYYYDAEGELVLEERYDGQGNQYSLTTYLYDEEGNCVTEVTCDAEGNVIFTETYS